MTLDRDMEWAMKDEQFKSNESFSLTFDDQRVEQPPTFERLQCRTQGQILFVGCYWMYAHEARALRDWLTKVLPKGERQMTIEVVGHVESLTVAGGADNVAVKLRIEASRSSDAIVLIAKRAEIGMYYPGMQVVVQVRPGPSA